MHTPSCLLEARVEMQRRCNAQNINDANWTFHGGDSCADRAITELCSDGSYRIPGDC